MEPTFQFRIYVAGPTPRSRLAEANLRALCEARVPGRHEIEVVDVFEHPEAAETGRVLATPTVVRLVPTPRRRVVGDLSDHLLAAIALELPPEPRGPLT